MKILKKYNQGSQADTYISKILGNTLLIKKYFAKQYMPKQLDKKLRSSRALSEARALLKANKLGIKCPLLIYKLGSELGLEFIKGKSLNNIFSTFTSYKKQRFFSISAQYLTKLHNADIIHGDFTLANFLFSNKDFYLIDFGLSKISSKIEDKAMDLITFFKSISIHQKRRVNRLPNSFLLNYKPKSKEKIIKRFFEILSRVRYMDKNKKR